MKNFKSLLLALLILSVFTLGTCDWNATISRIAPPGVYVGAFSFAGTTSAYGREYIRDLVRTSPVSGSSSNLSLVHLDEYSTEDFKTYVIDESYVSGSDNARPLMFAVNTVIDNLKKSEASLPETLDNVTIISFSTGLDQASADLANASSSAAYGELVRTKIRGTNQDTGEGQTLIKNKPINAYAVAVDNADSSYKAQQTTIMNYISSGSGSDGNIIWATNLTSLDDIFRNIATGLTSIRYISSITITVNGPATALGYSLEGEQYNFCATFDGNAPASSLRYIKGELRRDDTSGKYEIVNLYFRGIISDLEKAVESGRNGIAVDFGFPGLSGLSGNETLQEYYYGTGGIWIPLGGASGTSTMSVSKKEQKSAIVVLVLDATLSYTDLNNVKNAAKNFVQILYDSSIEQ